MNAQEAIQVMLEQDAVFDWKHYYRRFNECNRFSTRRRMRRFMKQIRREAALERRIAALERENARLHEGVEAFAMFDDKQVSRWFKKYRALNNRFKKLYEVAHNAVAHVGAANYPEREEEAHAWIDAV